MTSPPCRSAAAVNPDAPPHPMLPRLDRGEHRHTIEVGGIPPLLITCRPEDQHLTLPVVGCLVRGIFTLDTRRLFQVEVASWGRSVPLNTLAESRLTQTLACAWAQTRRS